MKSLADLQAIRDKMKTIMNIRDENADGYRVVVGMATCGIAAGARPVLTALLDEVSNRNLQNVIITQTDCLGICQYEPVVEVISQDGNKTTYVNMTAEKARKVIADHLVNNNVVSAFTIGNVK